jgi:hypothetical protein
MFEVTGNKGVYIKFPNGYSISIQWGPVNYCGNHSRDIGYGKPVPASSTAETAIMNPDGEFVLYKGAEVQGYQSVTEVLETMNYVAGLT